MCGGMRSHLLCKLKVNIKVTHRPFLVTNDCIRELIINEASLAHVMSLEVAFIDELGVVNTETLSSTEVVNQHIHQNDRKFGGVLTIASGHHVHLSLNGSRISLSSFMLFQFHVSLLQHFVRVASDHVLQKILNYLRKENPLEEDEIQHIINRMIDNCTFVDDSDDHSDRIVRIVLTKKSREEILVKLIYKLKRNRSVQTFMPMCVDEHQEGDKWLVLHNDRLSKQMTKQVHEPEGLIVHKDHFFAWLATKY